MWFIPPLGVINTVRELGHTRCFAGLQWVCRATSIPTCIYARAFETIIPMFWVIWEGALLINIGGPLLRVCQALPPRNLFLFF